MWPWRDCQPLYRVGCEVLVCLCRYEGLLRSLLLDWYLGSQKLREILTLLLLHQQEGFLAPLPGRSSLKSRHTKYPSQTHIPRIHIICHLPLVFLSPTSPLPFYSPSLSQSPLSFACVFVCLCVGLLVAMAQDNTKLCDFSNLYHKIPKIYLSYHIISIRSHFRMWPWRDWQPLYCVGCEFLFVCVGVWDFWGPPTRLMWCSDN